MEITTYGYKVPETNDVAKGPSGWMKAMEFNIERLDAHNHDGINSALIAPSAISNFTNTIDAANWQADGAGYYQDITVPAGITEVNNYNLKFIFTAPAGAAGEVAYLGYDRLTATTYRVYCNDNTAAFTVMYK